MHMLMRVTLPMGMFVRVIVRVAVPRAVRMNVLVLVFVVFQFRHRTFLSGLQIDDFHIRPA